MLWILVLIAHFERREIALQSSDLVLIYSEERREMGYLLLVLIVQTTDIEIGNESQHGSQQPTTTTLVHGNITYHESKDGSEREQLARDEAIVLAPQGCHLGSILIHMLLITCL